MHGLLIVRNLIVFASLSSFVYPMCLCRPTLCKICIINIQCRPILENVTRGPKKPIDEEDISQCKIAL